MDASNFLESAIKQFEYYKLLGEKAIAQIKDEDLFKQVNAESNSIAILVQHLHGNMMSRWTDFLTSDGEKEWRKRDEEFEEVLKTKEDVLKLWEQGWSCLFTALNALKREDLGTIIYIRNQGHTVADAILRQLAHYPYHVGQMVYLAKIFCNEDWRSLSIPRNKSAEYNADKFAAEKSKQHFTDEYLRKKKE